MSAFGLVVTSTIDAKSALRAIAAGPGRSAGSRHNCPIDLLVRSDRHLAHPVAVLGVSGDHLPMGIVDDLLEHPGLYLGVDHVVNADRVGAARIVITPLPGNSGVTLDYEIFNPATPERLLGHIERTIIGRSHNGAPVMVISDMHAASVAILRETEPGVFELGEEVAAYPMKVVISMPEPEHLYHSWWYGAPGEEPVERVITDAFRRV